MEKTAKEMFVALGYSGTSNKNDAHYSKIEKVLLFVKKATKVFRFDGSSKTFVCYWIYKIGKKYWECQRVPAKITVEEYKAAYQQMKELGWIE